MISSMDFTCSTITWKSMIKKTVSINDTTLSIKVFITLETVRKINKPSISSVDYTVTSTVNIGTTFKIKF